MVLVEESVVWGSRQVSQVLWPWDWLIYIRKELNDESLTTARTPLVLGWAVSPGGSQRAMPPKPREPNAVMNSACGLQLAPLSTRSSSLAVVKNI